MTKCSIFIDFDGTLVDIAPRHYRVYVSCLRSFNGRPLEMYEYWKLKRANTPWGQILQLSGVDPELEPEFLKLFIERIESDSELMQDELFPGSLATLDRLSKRHNLYLLSLRRNSQALERQIDNLGIRQYFQQILVGHSDTKEGVLKKKADVIKTASFDFKNLVVVGDTEADIAAAKQLNATSVALRSGIRNDDFLEKMNPDCLLDGIEEVAGLFD